MTRLLGVLIPFGVFLGLATAMITLVQFSTDTSIAQLLTPQPSTQHQ